MRSVDLVSREWCELIFEGRNHSYGAYRLRQEAGRRYFRALMGILLFLLLSVGSFVGINIYFAIQSQRELAQLLDELKRLEEESKRDSHLLKFVDLQRPKEAAPQSSEASVPEIVETPEVKPLPTPVTDEEFLAEEIDETLTEVVAEADTIVQSDGIDPPPLVPLTPTEIVQEMPEFPGGIAALMLWLDKNIIYPPLVIQQKVEGTTYLTFLVDKDGSVIEPKIEEPLHPMISASILRAARNMPKWEPGKKNGQVSIVSITIPIEYHL